MHIHKGTRSFPRRGDQSHLFLFIDASAGIRTISESLRRSKKRSRRISESLRRLRKAIVVCLMSSHYVSAKTASRTADIAVSFDSKEENPGIRARSANVYAMRGLAGASGPRRQMENAGRRRDRVSRRFRAGVTCLGGVLPILKLSGAAPRPRRNKLSRVM